MDATATRSGLSVRLRFYGMLAEYCQTDEQHWELKGRTVGELRQELVNLHWMLGTVPYQVAIGTELCPDERVIEDGQEIVLLPPFAGG